MSLIRTRRDVHLAALLAALVALTATTAIATDTVVSLNGVELRPQVAYESADLRVTGPDGIVIEAAFDGSSSIWLPLADDQGHALPDGEYSWSLTLTPELSPAVKEQLRVARERDDDAVVASLRARGILPDPDEMVSSGTLRVARGAFVLPGLDESAAAGASSTADGKSAVVDQDSPGEDQVIPDDLIVQGSACVGLDCVNNESFGFDTIRLKENNLRIKFEDTSASAGFPSTDWQLTANDSASGGANKFSIEDITGARVPFTISGGATTNSVFVDSSGRVGFRTATPVLDLHVATGNTPSLRLEQNGSSGFTPQTWDVAGNEANFFVRDVTGGSRLSFRIRPGAPTSSIDIAANGNVGIGTASPQSPLHVSRSDGSARIRVQETSGTAATRTLLTLDNNGTTVMALKNSQAGAATPTWELVNLGNAFGISIPGSGKIELEVRANGDIAVGGTVVHTSSRLAKHDLEAVEPREILEKVVDLPLQTWRYNHGDDAPLHLGPMAEDFHAAFGLGDDPAGISTLDTSGVALAAIQALHEALVEKDEHIRSLEQRMAALEAAAASRAD